MKHASYLSHIKFDKRLENSLQAKYLRNPRLLILVLLAIIFLGSLSYMSLPRRLNPEIKIPLVIVSTVYPGASPSDVETLVTDPLEDAVNGVKGIKTFTSSSRDSVSIIQIEFNSGTDPDKATSDVKAVIDSVDLPDDANDPTAMKIDFEQFPVWSFSITSKDNDSASLLTFSNELKKSLEEISFVDNVQVSGLEQEEIQILLKPEAITTYGFNPQSLLGSLANASKAFPAGVVRTDSSSFTLSIKPSVENIDDIRNTKIRAGEEIVNLSDIATVVRKSKPSQAQSFVASEKEAPRQSVTFSIYKNETANINKTVEEADKITNELLESYKGQFNIFTTSNVSEDIDHQFNELLRDFGLTVVLVFIALLIFLGIRQAVVASISIPLTFLISFIIMNVFGIALSFISFFSLLLALGLLVDDTIVVISAMTAYHRSGKFSPYETGLLVWRDFIVAIFTTTLTTVWAFVPLLLSSGIIGEFIKPIPIVMSATLLASFFVAMFITLPVITILLKPTIPARVKYLMTIIIVLVILGALLLITGKNFLIIPIIFIFSIILFLIYKLRNIISLNTKSKIGNFSNKYKNYLDNGILSFEPISIRYQLFIKKLLSSNKSIKLTIFFVSIFFIFSFLLVPLGFVKNEFFPRTEGERLNVSVELPSGTNIQTSKAEALTILNRLQRTEGIETISLDLGQTIGEFGSAGGAESNNFLYTLVLDEERKQSSFEIAESIRGSFNDYTKGKFTVSEESGGPPAGSDIQIKLLGPDLNVLDNYADNIIGYLEKQNGAENVNKSIKPGTSRVTFVPDQAKISDSGMSSDQIGLAFRTFASGFEISSLKLEEGEDSLDVTLRYSDETQFMESIDSLSVTMLDGSVVPLSSFGRLELESSPSLITREDSKRTVSVTASVSKSYSISDLNKNLEQYAESINLPAGYSWKTGGVNEENQESINSILMAMILSFLLILVTMVLQFSSFRKAIIVLLVIPLSISGVFIIFALSNTPLSFPALIGVLALFGIVVKNSILIVDKIQANEKTKMEFKEAIAEGASSRLEAIALTSFTAILGLIPITLSDPLWRGLGGAIIAGLTFSGTIMLLFIPVVYYLTFNPSRKLKKSSR